MWTLAENRFTKVGRDYIEALSGLTKSNKEDKRALFNTLTQLRLSEKYSLGLHLPVSIGHGDTSWFYIYPKGKNPYIGFNEIVSKFTTLFHFRDDNDFEHLNVTPSAMGAWQAYLYCIAPTILPTEWHGGYIRRTYFFSLEALDVIPFYLKTEYEQITERDLVPQVQFEKKKAKVVCCYWSDWAGLVRETISMRYDAKIDMIISFILDNKETLIPYNGGVVF